jgi:hypothetical protein
VLREALSAYVMPGLRSPYTNYSIRVEGASTQPVGDPVHLLYSSGCLIARCRDPVDVLVALVRELTFYDMTSDDHIIVRCAVLRRSDRRALLLSALARRQAVQQARRLRDAGLAVVDTPAVVLDPQTLEAVVPSPNFALDSQAFLRLGEGAATRVESALAEQRYVVDSWVFMSLPGVLDPAQRAGALVKAMAALWDESSPEAGTIQTLANLIRQTDALAAGNLTSLDLLPLLIEKYV